MSSTTISFPEDTIQCARGNYVLRITKDDRRQAFIVEDIVLLRRLVTLELESSMALIEEELFGAPSRSREWDQNIGLPIKGFVSPKRRRAGKEKNHPPRSKKLFFDWH